ncbi:MAG: hypothetical protein GQ468_01120, partial [Candidatus Scalindua sp.]|nr:hypothetical protein [Candidatus Scalindua sp.]
MNGRFIETLTELTRRIRVWSIKMIIVDTALQHRADAGNPVRVGLIGAG